MAERFIAFVPTLAPHTLSGPEIVEGLRQRFGDRIRLDLSAPSAPDGGVVVEILGLPVAVMFVERPLPQDAYARALMLNRTWPDAGRAISETRAHVIVATLSGVENWSDAFRMAAAVTLVTAVVVERAQGVGMIWGTGDAISSSAHVAEAAETVVARQAPVLAWSSLAILDGPKTATGQATVGAMTTGLVPFIGREIEFLPSVIPAPAMAERVIGLSHYLMLSGPVIKDGETVGVTPEEKIRVSFREVGQRPSIPVMQLEA